MPASAIVDASGDDVPGQAGRRTMTDRSPAELPADRPERLVTASLPASAAEALGRLLEGNRRFASGSAVHPRTSAERRTEVLAGQAPMAIVLSCADSRVPPEHVFDKGIGDLFVLRVAGNVADDAVLGSIEYGVLHLRVPLVVVLGHARCGAIRAALSGQTVPGRLSAVMDAIRPAVETVRTNGRVAPFAIDPDEVARVHARRVALRIREDAHGLDAAVGGGRAAIVAAYYDLATGRVHVL